MRTAAQLFALAAPLLVSAAPLTRRKPNANEILVFKFAHVLEQLESEFYRKAIEKFKVEDFLKAGYSSAEVAVEQLAQISFDEDTHTTVLEAAIKSFGEEPISDCTFNFDAVLTDVATTMTVARTVELVGVGAYLGAANLLADPRLLTAAGSILTNEARHQGVLNVLNGGASIPQAFDIPLNPQDVVAIAGGFISGCDIGVQGNDPLAITTTGPIGPGVKLEFQSKGIDEAQGQDLSCNMIVGGAATAIVLPLDQCIVPEGVVGPVALFITKDEQPVLAANIIDRDLTEIVSGPAIAFVDFGKPEQVLAQLVLSPDSPLTKDLNGASDIANQGENGAAGAEETGKPEEGAAGEPEASGEESSTGEESTGEESTGEEGSSTEEPSADEPSADEPSTDESSTDESAGGEADKTSGEEVDTKTQTFQGDIVPQMPTAAAAGGAASAPEPTLQPIAGEVDSAGQPLPTGTEVDSAGLPLATPDASGAGASREGATEDEIVPVVGGGAAAGPEVTEAGDVSVDSAPAGAAVVISD